MKLLVTGEDVPGSILRSLLPGLSSVADVTRVTAPVPGGVKSHAVRRIITNRLELARVDRRFLEAVRQLSPDVVLVIKGRGLSPWAIRTVRSAGIPVIVYYPDNPFWRSGDTANNFGRTCEADLAIVCSERVAELLRESASRVEVLPFGYDDRWYPVTRPDGRPRHGVAFLGTWSLRRERYLQALAGLPLVVHGSGWTGSSVPAGPPVYEESAGEVLRNALIGVNLLHPQNAGGHNMRTREIVASGALAVTDPGTDGSPLRPAQSCAWFRSPADLREQIVWFLDHPDDAKRLATRGQALIADDSYVCRGQTMAKLIAETIPC